MVSIEKLTAFHSIKSYLSEADQLELAQKLGITEADIRERLTGKEKEIEFILTLDFLACCEHIVAFDEGVSQLTESDTPDLFVTLKSGKKFFIEIKSTKKDRFKITKGSFEKRVQFVKQFGFPLYFAVNIRQQWGLFSSDYLESQNYKIGVKDFTKSEFDHLFGNYYWLFLDGFRIESIYSKQAPRLLSHEHPEYGSLISYCLYFRNQLMFRVTDPEHGAFKIMMLRPLQDFMSRDGQKVESLGNGQTKVITNLIKPVNISFHHFMMNPIISTIHQLGFMFDPNAYYRQFLDNKERVPFKEMLDYVLAEIKHRGGGIIQVMTQKQIDSGIETTKS